MSSYTDRDSSLAVESHLSANWGNIAIFLVSLPVFGACVLNPISLFFIGCGLFWGLLLTFSPKLLYFGLLELAIAQGRGSDFYHAHHTRRIGVERSLSLTYVESVVVRAASLFGGVEVAGRKMVAGARKKYAELPLGITQVVERALSLPGNVYPAVKLHVIKYFSVLYHLAMRWFALNVVAHLYTKRVQ